MKVITHSLDTGKYSVCRSCAVNDIGLKQIPHTFYQGIYHGPHEGECDHPKHGKLIGEEIIPGACI